MGKIRTSQEKLLMKFGASNQWKAMLYHCRCHSTPSQHEAFSPILRANHILPRHTDSDHCTSHLRGYDGFKTDQNCHEPCRCIHLVAYDILHFRQASIRTIGTGSHFPSSRSRN